MRSAASRGAAEDRPRPFDDCPELCDLLDPTYFAVVPDGVEFLVSERVPCTFTLGFEAGRGLLLLNGPLSRARTD